MGNAGKAMFPTPWKIHELFTITHYVDWLIVPSTTTFNVEPKKPVTIWLQYAFIFVVF